MPIKFIWEKITVSLTGAGVKLQKARNSYIHIVVGGRGTVVIFPSWLTNSQGPTLVSEKILPADSIPSFTVLPILAHLEQAKVRPPCSAGGRPRGNQ